MPFCRSVWHFHGGTSPDNIGAAFCTLRLGGRYLFQDWFDGADRHITAETAEQLAELFGLYPEEG